VFSLDRAESKRGSDGVEDLAADIDRSALLEPGVPSDADARELGKLFAA
jgi:hypothetical protein